MLIEEGDCHLNVEVVKFTSFHVGYAYGKLMADEIKDNLKKFWNHYYLTGVKNLEKHVPGFLAISFLKLGISAFRFF